MTFFRIVVSAKLLRLPAFRVFLLFELTDQSTGNCFRSSFSPFKYYTLRIPKSATGNDLSCIESLHSAKLPVRIVPRWYQLKDVYMKNIFFALYIVSCVPYNEIMSGQNVQIEMIYLIIKLQFLPKQTGGFLQPRSKSKHFTRTSVLKVTLLSSVVGIKNLVSRIRLDVREFFEIQTHLSLEQRVKNPSLGRQLPDIWLQNVY